MTCKNERPSKGERAGVEANTGRTLPTREYATRQITVQWYADRCIHSGNCVRALPLVFNPRRRPWVNVEAGDADAIERAVLRCPSGALQYVRHDNGHPEPSDNQHDKR